MVRSRWEITTRSLEGHMIATCVERQGPGSPEVTMKRADLNELAIY